MKRNGWWLVVCLLLAACSGDRQAAEQVFVGTDISAATFGNPLRLTDHNGAARQLSDFRGKVVVLFFGYTQCPDVCPTTMADLTSAMRLLGGKREQVQVLFVTLDPERDTRQLLAQYVPAFDASFLGLYGDVATTAQVAKDFKVYYQKQLTGGAGGYTVDHSAGMYVFDKKGALRVFLAHGQKPQDIAHDLQLLM